MKRPLVTAVSIVLAGAALLTWLWLDSSSPPAVVLISIDTLRADHLSAYGYARPTPHLDGLAEEGWLFSEAHSAAPWTLPSHMSLVTGRYPSTHGVVDDDRILPADLPTLAEALSRQGYQCAGFVAHTYLDRRFGFARGFDEYTYRQYSNSTQQPSKSVRGDAVIDEALRYLESRRDGSTPYFLFVHLFDPHWTYGAPPPFRGRYSADYRGPANGTIGTIIQYIDATKREMAPRDLQHLIDLYDEEIAFVDHLVGRLVSRVRSLPGGDRAVIILTSDHGEEFLEHGSLGHATTLYREQTHVPLIVVDPESGTRGQRIDTPVSTVDVAPTIAQLAGVPADDPFWKGLDGIPLQIHRGSDGPVSRWPIAMETTRWGPPRSALVFEQHKCIAPMAYDWIGNRRRQGRVEKVVVSSWNRPRELYDWLADPAERSPLASGTPSRAQELLDEWEERTWRGVLLELEVPQDWVARIQLPDGAELSDEPYVRIGSRVRELEPRQGVVSLSGLGPGAARVFLPVALGEGELEIIAEAGSATWAWASQTRALAPGDRQRIPLDARLLDDPPAVPDLAGPRVRLRARSAATRPDPAPLDPEIQRVLDSLGYLRR